MKEYLVSCGVNTSKIVELNIFDYLTDENKTEKVMDKTVVYAENLTSKKSPFLADIGKLGIKLDLYGINYIEENYNTTDVTYKGSFLSDDLPAQLNKGFGLVWDGDSSETCSGTGDYLRLNNPHKLSLYLVSDLPVFIWKEAAEAKFVEENKVGFLINSLSNIKTILRKVTKKQYSELIKNTALISEKLSNGYFTIAALDAVEKLI